MRSRYTAYALGLVDYIALTQVEPADRQAIQRFCGATRFLGLAPRSVPSGARLVQGRGRAAPGPRPSGFGGSVSSATTDTDQGTVTFRATLTQQGLDVSFVERSRFVRENGRWRYVDGDRIEG